MRAGGTQANGVVECAIAAFNERKAAYLAADYKKSKKFLGAVCNEGAPRAKARRALNEPRVGLAIEA